MKKMFFLAALAAFPLTSFAQTQVTLYGNLQLSVFGSRTFDGGAEQKTITRIDDTDSFLGFRGSEALGGGTNAVWQIESYVSGDGTTVNGGDGANKLASRDTYVGLESFWGTLRLGHLSDYMNEEMATMDAWSYSDTVNGLGIMTRFDSRYGNAIRYDAPDLGGLKLALIYSADEQRDNGDNAFALGIGGGYEYGGFFAKGGFMQFQDQNGNGDKSGNYWRVEGGYEDDLFVILAYQQSTQYGAAATGDTNNVWGRSTGDYGDPLGGSSVLFGDDDKLKTQEVALAVGYPVGAFLPHASFALGSDVKVNGQKLNDSGYKQFVVGADYALSERSQLFISFGYVKYDGKIFADGLHDKEYSFGIGMQHAF
ncbi:MAG: porin [Burkholderiales bacterium]|jgi:predicted porin|nr:porin [Burkholderiales bacterium]